MRAYQSKPLYSQPCRPVVLACLIAILPWVVVAASRAARPNIFIAISDDQSWPHTSAYGSQMVQTPNFDRVAREGILFHNAFCPSPGCSPSRAAFLTGLNTWQLEHAGTHASYFSPRFQTFPERLQEEGYFVGHCGKGWGPGNFKKLGRTQNPAGPRFNGKGERGKRSYSAAFAEFLDQRPEGKPFCFWFGSSDPHRSYRAGSGEEKGKQLTDAEVPSFLLDTPEIRRDLLDYAFEVERFDNDLGKMLELLEQHGELDNTLVIVTSDNGMPFPRAKANCYEYGIHMPLAVRWSGIANPGRAEESLVSFLDLTATIYETTEVSSPSNLELQGKSLGPIISGTGHGSRDAAFSARERHSSSRYHSLGYPQRCIRTQQFLFIYNFAPERWPAGPARKLERPVFDEAGKLLAGKLGAFGTAFHDIDACPTLSYLVQHREDPDTGRVLEWAVGRRPAAELYDIRDDPGCLKNLAGDPAFAEVQRDLKERLWNYLKETKDARVLGEGDVWENYPRVSSLRWFAAPDWANDAPEKVPSQPWLEARRPKSQ